MHCNYRHSFINVSNSGNDTIVKKSACVSFFEGDVTCISPRSSPRVSDNPVSVGFITNEDNCMIEFAWAAGTIVEDTTFVRAPFGSINGDGDWLNVQGSCKSGYGVGDCNTWWGVENQSDVGVACSINSCVGISSFSSDTTIGNNVCNCRRWHTTAATVIVVSSWAVNKLLFRERNDWDFVENHIGTLEKTNSWESPAWTTLTLVFHRGENVLISPVDDSSLWGIIVRNIGILWNFRDENCHEIETLEFVFSEIGETIETHLVGFFRVSVVLLDGEVVFHEDRLSVVVFFRGSSLDAVLAFP